MQERTEILLREYETCQSHTNSIGSQVWVSTTIFLSINIALLGGVIYSLIANNFSPNARWLVLTLGLGIILIFANWIRWLKRMQFLTSINYERMREIEDRLNMEKTWMAGGLDLKYNPKRRDDWNKLSVKWKKKLNKLSERYPSKFWKRFPKYAPPRGFEGTRYIAWIVMVIWVVFILMVFFGFEC